MKNQLRFAHLRANIFQFFQILFFILFLKFVRGNLGLPRAPLGR